MPGPDQPAAVQVRVLGALELVTDGVQRPFPPGRPGRVLADLLLARGRVVSAPVLIEDVWGDEPPEDPRAALHTTVARVRRALGPAGTLVVWRSPGYLVDSRRVRLDSEDFLDLAARARAEQDATAVVAGLEEALALWQGPAWGELAQDLAQGDARRLEDARLAAREDRAAALLETDRWAEATGDLRVLVAEQPLRERAVGLLMRCLHRSGDVGEALAAFAAHRDLLADELGLDPTAELAALHGQVLRRDVPGEPRRELSQAAARDRASQDPAPQDPGPPDPGPFTGGPPGGVRLHGREAHLATLRDMLARHRCVTVVGPGGVGKTSVARSLLGESDSAWWVDLASVQTPEGVLPAVARAMQVEVYPGGTLGESLLHRFATASGLLVLDNCEHLLGAAADVVTDLLLAGTGVTVLVTSRERLGLHEEQVMPLPPLRLPSRVEIPEGPAVALFLERATAVAPELVRDPDTLTTVGALVRALDGLPLAIELAAGRVGTLTLRDLADRLGDRLDLLRSTSHRPGSRGNPRQLTLASTIEWSYALLDDEDARVFRSLSVFAGAFDLPAAEAILGPAAADRVADLVERSLLSRPGATGPGRYRMLETLRAFARSKLSSDEASTLSRAHAGWAATCAEALAHGLRGPDEARWCDDVDRVLPDLAAAVRWSTTSGDPSYAARIVAALHPWAYYRLRADVLAWSLDVIALDSAEARTPGAYAAASAHAWMAGRSDDAVRYGEQALAAAGGADAADAIPGLLVLIDTALAVGDLDRARTCSEEAYRLSVAEGLWLEAATAACGGLLTGSFAGRPRDEDVRTAQEAARRADNPTLTSLTRYSVGESLAESDPDTALGLFVDAARIAETVGNRLVAGVSLTAETALRSRSGSLDAATLARARVTLAHWLSQAGSVNLLVTCLRNTLPLLDRLDAHPAVVELAASTTVGSPTRPSYGAEADRMQATLHRAHDALGDQEFERAWAVGAGRTVAEAGQLVLDELTALERRLSGD